MRHIDVKLIKETVSRLFIEANYNLGNDIVSCIETSEKNEKSSLAKDVLNKLLDNLNASKEINVPICQDTGMAVIFMNIGQEVYFTGGSLKEAINDGVKDGYEKGYMRMSVVKDPLERINTNTNTPAIIHTNIVDGDKIEILVCPKGFGSENMSSIKMFTPSATIEDIEDYIVSVVDKAGSNPCPPVIVGVGIGGDFEYCAYLAKKALCRDANTYNKKELYENMEKSILKKINSLGIGPSGFGGNTTALKVNIEEFPTHIAGLPVAVNIGCHVTRHKKFTI